MVAKVPTSDAAVASPPTSSSSSQTAAPASPDSPATNLSSSASEGIQPRTPASQNGVLPSQNDLSRQNTLHCPSAPARTPTIQITHSGFKIRNGQPPPNGVSAPRKGSRPQQWVRRLSSALSPSTHDPEDKAIIPTETSRPYSRHQQRWRLRRKTFGELCMTLLLCVGYFVVLYLYHLDKAIDRMHRRMFNSLVTGISLFLGINLSASLKSYVKMLRWSILATHYRSLELFDLILGSDSVTNVIKLVWHGRKKERPFLINIFTSKTSILALLWLVIQLGIAVCVGIIGLTYNLDVNVSYVNTQTGNTSSIDLGSLPNYGHLPGLALVNTYGIKGDNIDPTYSPTLSYDDTVGDYLLDDQGTTRYFFVDYNPDRSSVNSISRRYIDCNVSCSRSIVTQGQYGRSEQITYTGSDGSPVNVTLYQTPEEGGSYAVANINSTCGERCVTVKVFQAAIDPTDAELYNEEYDAYIDQGTWFSCDVTVSDVLLGGSSAGKPYAISHLVSRMLAGSYAWSDNAVEDDNFLYQTYEVAGELAFLYVPEEGDMVQKLSQVAMDGIQAMDDPNRGLARQYVPDGRQPIQAQKLVVKWWAAGSLLAIIPFVQFWVWIMVIAMANKVVIKDDTPLSMAKIYWTLLKDTLGERGCMLDGKQLIEKVGEAKVIYGFTEGSSDDAMKHVDVYQEGSGCDPARTFLNPQRSKDDKKEKREKKEFGFPEGEYDGLSGEVRKRTVRKVDARAYF